MTRSQLSAAGRARPASRARLRSLRHRSLSDRRSQRLDVGRRALREWRDAYIESGSPADMAQQRAVDPVDHGTVVLARAEEAGAVVADVGQEQVMAMQPPERVDHRQNLGEAVERAVIHVNPDIAVGFQLRAQRLAGQLRPDLVEVQALKRYVPFLEPERRPYLLPEGHCPGRITEVLGQRVAQQFGAEPEQLDRK